MKGIVLSLCDRSGVMVQPWLEAGYECWIVDTQHPAGRHRSGNLMRIGCDVRTFNAAAMLAAPLIVFAFPPCTNLSVSGARWFKDKGLESLHESLGMVVACERICEDSGAPWMLENPVGMLSSYWRKPDYTFQPWQYGDTYTKKTCLWTGNGFVMPPAWHATKPERHNGGDSPDAAIRGSWRQAECDAGWLRAGRVRRQPSPGHCRMKNLEELVMPNNALNVKYAKVPHYAFGQDGMLIWPPGKAGPDTWVRDADLVRLDAQIAALHRKVAACERERRSKRTL